MAGKMETKPRAGDIKTKQMWCKSHIGWNAAELHGKTPKQPHSGHDARHFWAKINIAFTDYSRLEAMMSAIRKEIRKSGQGLGTMNFLTHLIGYAAAIREFVAPTYRPERYYMRGPGPACARRGNSLGVSAH
ncbi:hypothetical protein [Mesorhizobium sp.]